MNNNGSLNDYYNEEFFNLDDNLFIKINFIYLNTKNEIIKIKENILRLTTPNLILRNELVHLLTNNNKIENVRFIIYSILKYNITLNASQIKDFINTNSNNNSKYLNYLSFVKTINNITFNKSVNIFQDLNELIIIYKEKEKPIEIQNIINNNNNNNNKQKNIEKTHELNKTKRIFIHSHKKTYRNKSNIVLAKNEDYNTK